MFEGMGAGGAQADLGLLYGAGTDADTGAIDLDAMLNNLLNHIGPMMDAEWQGQGGRTFRQTQEACEGEMRRLTGALRSLGRKVGDTSIAYAGYDEEVQTLISNRSAEAGTITTCLSGE